MQKNSNLNSFDDIMDAQFGAPGSAERDAFNREAETLRTIITDFFPPRSSTCGRTTLCVGRESLIEVDPCELNSTEMRTEVFILFWFSGEDEMPDFFSQKVAVVNAWF